MDIEHNQQRNISDSETGPQQRAARASVLRRTVRLTALVGAVVGLGVALTACQGGSAPGVASAGGTKSTGSANGSSNGSANGQSSGGKGVTSGSPGSQSGIALAGGNPTQQLAFSQCMRAHGVTDFPDPGSNGAISINGGSGSDLNPNNPTFQRAQKACQSKLPQPSAAQQAQALKSALAMARCMREHGISDFPDPQSGPGGRISLSLKGSSNSDLNPNDPAFQKAQKACMPNAPRLNGGPGGGPSVRSVAA